MTTHVSENASPSRRIASEIRAELARQGINQTALARLLHVSNAWTSRRLSPSADVDLTFEEVEKVAKALGVSAERLRSWWLPRLDSNQQPSGYLSGQVIDLADYRSNSEKVAS